MNTSSLHTKLPIFCAGECGCFSSGLLLAHWPSASALRGRACDGARVLWTGYVVYNSVNHEAIVGFFRPPSATRSLVWIHCGTHRM